jgi:hypothetical protein
MNMAVAPVGRVINLRGAREGGSQARGWIYGTV